MRHESSPSPGEHPLPTGRSSFRRPEPGFPSRVRRPLGLPLTALALLALLGAGCSSSSSGRPADRGSGQRAEKKPDAIAVRVAPVEVRTLAELWSTSATLRPEARAMVLARTAGVVERLEVEAGDWVRENDLLAQLEDDELRIALERARIAEETKRAEHDRAKDLHGRGLVADEAYDLKLREWREAKNAAELARLNLSRTQVRAPFAGRVLERFVDEGATVSNGTDMFELADLEPLEADVNVPESQVARMSSGQTVRLSADARDTTVEARIVRIAPAVNPETGTVKVTVAVAPQKGLRPGSFVRVDIVTGEQPDARVVPRSALVAEGRRWHLFALTDDGEHVERIAVSPGFEEQGVVAVLGPDGGPSPLDAGRRVVVLGAPALSDGARVSVAGGSERAGERS